MNHQPQSGLAAVANSAAALLISRAAVVLAPLALTAFVWIGVREFDTIEGAMTRIEGKLNETFTEQKMIDQREANDRATADLKFLEVQRQLDEHTKAILGMRGRK